MQQRREKREINGILLLDKPRGLSSNNALQRAKRIFRARKAGHTGSLDPLATGVLPICFGEATKFSQYLLDSDKEYEVVAELGVRTTTGDAEGEIAERKPVPDFSEQEIADCLEHFRGESEQLPSMFSAIKLNGQPLYKLARKGVTVERKPRKIIIHELELKERTATSLHMRVRCSKGTYIRNLVEDMGAHLGCGGTVTALRRTHVGQLSSNRLVTLDELEQLAAEGDSALDGSLLPIDAALSDWLDVELSESAFFYLSHGRAVNVPNLPAGAWVCLRRHNGDFIGIGEVLEDGRVAPRRVLKEVAEAGQRAGKAGTP